MRWGVSAPSPRGSSHPGGDYVLGLKGHQSTLPEPVEDLFEVATAGDLVAVTHDVHEAIDKDRGRLEVRRDWIPEEWRTRPDNPLWAGLRRIGRVERHRTIGTTETVERRDFIHSLPAQAKGFANAVRGHWGETACIGDPR